MKPRARDALAEIGWTAVVVVSLCWSLGGFVYWLSHPTESQMQVF